MIKKIIFTILLQTMLFGTEIFNNEFHFHGQFCGKEVPDIETNSRAEEFDLLSRIVPIDVIDKACKEHDLCYLKEGDDSPHCDKKLVLSLEKIHDKLEGQSCRRLSRSIIYFFTLKNDNPIKVLENDDSTALKMVKMPTTSFRNMMDTFSFSTNTMTNYAYSKPFGYVLDSDKNSERKKEVLQIFPPKNKVCTLSK